MVLTFRGACTRQSVVGHLGRLHTLAAGNRAPGGCLDGGGDKEGACSRARCSTGISRSLAVTR